MMIHFERELIINAAPDAVWDVLSRFMHIDEFAPQIASVDALTDGEIGKGSKRRNHFENGTSLVEEVIDWRSGAGYTVKLSDMGSIPFKEASSEISIAPTDGQAKVTWGLDYRVKYGPIGWLLGQTLLKLGMGKVIDGNLKGLADKVRIV